MSLDQAATGSAELLRAALLCKLAVDLEDPRLARRAAWQAITCARLLTALDFPDGRDSSGDEHDDELPEVDDLLEQLKSQPDLEEPAPETSASAADIRSGVRAAQPGGPGVNVTASAS